MKRSLTGRHGLSLATVLCLICLPADAQSIRPASPPVTDHPPRVVVILDFDTAGQGAAPTIGRSVAEGMRVYLSRSPRYQIVERQRLDAILREQKLQLSDLVDPRTASKVGRLLGADAILHGMVSRLGDSYWLTARMVDVATSRCEEAADARAETETAIRGATYQLASKLGLGEVKVDDLDEGEAAVHIKFDPDVLDRLQAGMRARANAEFDEALSHLAYVRSRVVDNGGDPSELEGLSRNVTADGAAYARDLIRLLKDFDAELAAFAGGGRLEDVITRLRAVNHRYYQLLTRVHATDATSPWEEIIDDFERAERNHEEATARGKEDLARQGLDEMRHRSGSIRKVLAKMIRELEASSNSQQAPRNH